MDVIFNLSSTPINHIGKIRKNSGVKELASPITPSAKNQAIIKAVIPLKIILTITKIDLIYVNPPLFIVYE